MTHDQIDRMVRQANPVPDLTALGPVDASVLALDQQRRTDMKSHDPVALDEAEKNPRRSRAISIGIAAAVVAIFIAVIAFQPGDPAPVADDPPSTAEAPSSVIEPVTDSPTELAAAFLDAYASFDMDRAASYLSGDALAEFGDLDGTGDPGWRQAVGFSLLAGPCEVEDTAPSGTSVRCPYDYHSLRSDEIGLGPYSGSVFELTISDGAIVSFSDEIAYMSNGLMEELWVPFGGWVSQTYPDDAGVMYDNETDLALGAESVALWEQHTREWAELRTSDDAYTARAEAICTAAQATYLEALEASGEAGGVLAPAMMEIAAPILRQALADLRLVTPPEAVRAQFEADYLLLEQETEYLRQQGVGFDPTPPPEFPVSDDIHSSLQGCTVAS